MKIEKHRERLVDHYVKKNLEIDQINKFVQNKMNKFNDNSPENYHSHCRDLLNAIPETVEEPSVLDLGGGTGELATILNGLGAQTDMVEIYQEELIIAKELFRDNNISTASVHDTIPDKKYDLVTMFSVLEHMDDDTITKILEKLYRNKCARIYVLVPNMYKIIDDHTGVPFLGLLNRSLVQKILQLLNIKYNLSESNEWDVWYRSVKQIEKIALSQGYRLIMIGANEVFPSIEIVPTIDLSGSSFLPAKMIKRLYGRIIKYFDERNKYPYLNFYLIKNEY